MRRALGAPTKGAVAERLRERILVNFAPYDKLTHNLKLCLSFRGAERRGNPFSSGIMCIPLAVHRGCGLRDRCVHRSRNDRTLCCLFFSIMAADRVWRPLSPVCALGTVSLRLGHGAALTCHRHVIHYRAAASLPKRGAKRMQCNERTSPKSLPPTHIYFTMESL